MKTIILTLIFVNSISAFADNSGSNVLATRLNGQTLVCQSAGKEVGTISAVNGQIEVSEGLCWVRGDVSVETTPNFVILTCGEDTMQTTTLSLGEKLTKKSDAIDGTTYVNISVGYPNVDGAVQYLTCSPK